PATDPAHSRELRDELFVRQAGPVRGVDIATDEASGKVLEVLGLALRQAARAQRRYAHPRQAIRIHASGACREATPHRLCGGDGNLLAHDGTRERLEGILAPDGVTRAALAHDSRKRRVARGERYSGLVPPGRLHGWVRPAGL